jgi:hypothetical protein
MNNKLGKFFFFFREEINRNRRNYISGLSQEIELTRRNIEQEEIFPNPITPTAKPSIQRQTTNVTAKQQLH